MPSVRLGLKRAEAACLERDEQAQALLDLTTAFEMVSHQNVLDAARRKGYPLSLLRMYLAASLLKRRVGMDGVYSRLIKASRGISAGWLCDHGA